MNKIWKWIKDNIKHIIMILILISCLALIVWFFLLFFCVCWITKEKIVIWILIPMICALIWASITIAMDNSLSNEKLKLALERLKWRRTYHCEDENGNKIDWYKSFGFDEEYKLISKNRWKSYDEILNEMIDKDYREAKYSNETEGKNITKENFFMNWIEDHFIY